MDGDLYVYTSSRLMCFILDKAVFRRYKKEEKCVTLGTTGNLTLTDCEDVEHGFICKRCKQTCS